MRYVKLKLLNIAVQSLSVSISLLYFIFSSKFHFEDIADHTIEILDQLSLLGWGGEKVYTNIINSQGPDQVIMVIMHHKL